MFSTNFLVDQDNSFLKYQNRQTTEPPRHPVGKDLLLIFHNTFQKLGLTLSNSLFSFWDSQMHVVASFKHFSLAFFTL